MHRFEGRRCVVTGAADGVGRATARRLVAEGAQVAVADIAVDKLDAVAEELGAETRPFEVDVADEGSVEALFDEAAAWLGGLDAVAHCAGIVDFGVSHELPLDRWQRVIDVVLTGTFLVNRAAIPRLLDEGGAVVNIGSIGGLRGKAWQVAYSSAKAGVANLTRALACEYVGRIRFNVVAPGGLANDIVGNSGARIPPDGVSLDEFMEEYGRRVIGPKPPADPSEIAAVVAFLLSDDARYIDGATIVADGATLA